MITISNFTGLYIEFTYRLIYTLDIKLLIGRYVIRCNNSNRIRKQTFLALSTTPPKSCLSSIAAEDTTVLPLRDRAKFKGKMNSR